MTVFEITAPDGRVLEIEGEKAPSETELNEIFKTVPLSQDAKYGKLGQTTISATPKRNIISDFTDCLKWVNNTRIAAYQEGKNQVEIAGLEAKDMFGRATQNDLNRLEQLSSQPENTYGIPEKRKFIDENETNFFPRLADTVSIGAKKGYVEALKMLPYMWETIKAGGVGAGVGAAGGAVIGTGVGMATTKTNTPALAMQGARLGASWGGRISGSIKLAELEGGLARNELRQINKEIIEKGGEPLSDAEINTLAIGVGGINAGLEMVSLKQMLKTVPGGDKVLEYLEKKNLRELAVNKTVREQLRGILGQYTKTIGTEITTEMAQETTNIVAGELARKFGRIDATPLEQNVARVIDTGKATFGATLYLGGVGSAAKAVTILGKQGLTRPQAEAKVAEMSAEEQQEFVANNLDALFESAKDIPSVQESEKINEIKNHYFTQDLNAGLEKTEALATAEIEANAAAIMSKQYGISLDEAKDRLALNVQSLTDEQAAEQMQADTKVLQGGVEMEVEKNPANFQAAMYKSPMVNFEDFYNQVFEKENSKSKSKKSYFDFNNGNVSVRIPHDTIVHDENKHKMSANEWEEILNNLDKPSDVVVSSKPRFDGQPILLKIIGENQAYGAVVEFFENKQPIITTAFADEETNIDKWLNKNRSAQAKNTSSVTTKGMLLSQDHNTIMTYLKENFKPVVKTYYQGMDDNIDSNIQNARGFTYRRFNFDGTVKDNLIVLLKNKSDKSTLLHEFAHVYLTTLNDLARDNAKAKADLLVVNKWLGYNGIEYTDFQHEKFANGFVAYVKTGKAPTYGLKKAFEQFKRWLNELYNELVYSDEIQLDKDAKAVFDEILGGKSQEAVAEQIKDFVKKAENNALLRLRAEKVEKRELPQNILTEYQRKYRDTAYDIIWYALSHIKKKEGGFEEPLVKDKRQLYMLFGNDSKVSSKNKGIMKQAEKLEFVLNEVDDVFSGNDGFLSEWGEFFNDPGIGQNEGADTTLALTALDVIKQRKYLYETEKAFEGITEEDIKRAQYELDYILDEFKNNSDRDLVVAGFFDWIENQPEFLQEDFITKWENSTNEIERYEALTKFEQAKEDLKLYAATLKGFGDYSWQFAEYARKILKRLDFMTEHDKAKIFDKLKDFNSFREIERNLDDVMDYAETLNDVSLRRNLADTIVNEVKRTTPIIKNGTKKTRYDYRTNKLFERLRYLNKLKQEEIQDLYDAYVNGEIERRASQFDENGTITGKTESYFEDIENSFLQFKANGMYYNSTELLQTLLSKIQNAKFTGKIARDEMDFEQRMNQENWINSCAQTLETHRGKSGKIEEIYSMEANFDSMLSMVFNDDIKNQFSLDDLYAQVDGRVGKDREEILNKIAEIFGFSGALKGAMLNNKFIEMANEKFTIKQRYANKERWGWEPVTLSKMEVLYYYIQAKNPVSYSMLTDMGDETHSAKGQFDKFEFDELLKNLSDQEKLMGDALQIAAEKYYNDLNKYHIKKHHIDLGKATCYFPRKSELKEINELDLFNQYTEKSTNPKFVKMRSAGPSIRIAPANPVNVLFNHIQKANTIIIMGDKLDLMNKVFRDNDLGQKIKSVFGDIVYKEFMQHVTENLYDGQAKALSNAEGIISKLMSNIIGVPMFIKPQVGLNQVLGLINYGVGDEYVGTLEWMKAFTNVIKNPKSAIDFMMQDEYLKDRLTRGNMNEAMKNQIDNKLSSKLSLLTDYFSLNMRYGDLFNLTLGGKAYVDVLMSKGYTKTQAFELFRKKTISDQQSSIASTLSNLQRNSKNNPFARLLFAYQNTPHQYFRICANAIIKAKRGRMSKSQAVKTVFIYWWFLPFIFNMAGSLSPITLIATGDSDELINDMLIACLGSISCIPFFGEMARALFAGVTGSEYFGNKDWFTRANEAIVRPINKFRKGNLRFEDILKSLEIFAQGVGIPLEEIDTQLEAFGDYANGDFGKGVIKTLGYSRYRADAVTGDK